MKLPISLFSFRKRSEHSLDFQHAIHIVTRYEAYQNLCRPLVLQRTNSGVSRDLLVFAARVSVSVLRQTTVEQRPQDLARV